MEELWTLSRYPAMQGRLRLVLLSTGNCREGEEEEEEEGRYLLSRTREGGVDQPCSEGGGNKHEELIEAVWGQELRGEATAVLRAGEGAALRPEAVASAPRVTVGLGRILPLHLQHLLGVPLENSADSPLQGHSEVEVAICGPPGFTDDMEAMLKGNDIGLGSEHIHTERWW